MSRVINNKCRSDLKIVIVGNSGTGKTSFCSRWVKDSFSDNYKATIMSEFSYKIYEYKGHYYKIQFWDIAGQDKNVYTSKVFTKDAHGCIILCDITNQDTLEATLKWKKSIDDNALFKDGGKLPCVLVQNKIDLVSEEALGNDGRILVRESGTEMLLRVMVEAKTSEECSKYANQVVDVLKANGHAVDR